MASEGIAFAGLKVLDIGCGEGKNAAYLARCGATVEAVDISALAIEKARRLWPESGEVRWRCADVQQYEPSSTSYDLVVCYGLLHCLGSGEAVKRMVSRIQELTAAGGWNVVCSFNDRHQELDAHPGFTPILLPHSGYAAAYDGWDVRICTDTDLIETHPDLLLAHSHSMTRIVARRR